jgi:hypothetical protein
MTAVTVSHLYRVGGRWFSILALAFLKSESDLPAEPRVRAALEHQLTLVSPPSNEPVESSKNSDKTNPWFLSQCDCLSSC